MVETGLYGPLFGSGDSGPVAGCRVRAAEARDIGRIGCGGRVGGGVGKDVREVVVGG